MSVGPLFGELLAGQFTEWLDQIQQTSGNPSQGLMLAEAGAHRGELARDILVWLRAERRELFEGVIYWLIEPSDRRQEWQRSTLAEFAGKVRWAKGLADLALHQRGLGGTSGDGRFRGVLFSNELLDAFPVHRLGWDAQRREWFEWGVTQQQSGLTWTRMPAAKWLVAAAERSLTQGTTQNESGLSAALSEDLILEVAPGALRWWRQASRLLGCGKLLTLDYGLTTEELPDKRRGTLCAYRQHHVSADILADPGEQDLTAHVNFSALQMVGEAAGLRTETFSTQEQFLTRIAARTWRGELKFGEWTAQRRRQFQTLTHPEHLGRTFRVLVQSR